MSEIKQCLSSKEKLAKALLDYRCTELENTIMDSTIRKINKMIERAKEGYYSDFDSPLEMPCVQLVKDLVEIGALSLANRAKNGEFDATKEESYEWYEKEGKRIMEDAGLSDLFDMEREMK